MDARNYDLPVQSDYADGSGARPAIGLADIVDTLRREWRLPLVGCLIGLTLAIAYIGVVKTPYKSTARILIDRSVNRYLQTNKIIDQPTFDEQEIGSQVYVLSSDSVVVPVVRSMNLTRDTELVGPPRIGSARIPDYFRDLKDVVRKLAGLSADTSLDAEASLERTAVEAVQKRLGVTREDVANVINVSFESEDPNKAANIANALADTYLSSTLETKLKSTRVVGQWLQERMVELKAQATDADRALQNYRLAHNLASSGSGAQSSEQLANLNQQLTNARIAVAEAKQRLDRIKQVSGEGVTTAVGTDALLHPERSGVINYALNNSDLVRLRSQYRDLAARAADIEARVGPKHGAAVKLRRQLDALRIEIKAEEQRIADAYANEYQVALAREAEITARSAQLSGNRETGSELRELESSAETLRNLYNSTLQKLKEVNTVQTETMPVQNARIITRAAPPLNRSSKKAFAVLAGSLLLGLCLGAGAAVGREWLSDVFRTARSVEQVTDTRCVVLPMIDANARLLEEFVLEAPYSRFTEALRNVKALIDAGHNEPGARVIGVVSSLPNEGKTTVTANLAALTIAATGARTLVIDSDFHLRKLTAALAPDAREGLIEALDNPSRLATVVARRRSGLDVLACVCPVRIPNSAEWLGLPEMERLLAAARKSYDYIFIEIAPILSVVDVKIIERFVDGFVFVVASGQTRRSHVLDALADATVIRERLLGIVLNKADPVALQNSADASDDYHRDASLVPQAPHAVDGSPGMAVQTTRGLAATRAALSRA